MPARTDETLILVRRERDGQRTTVRAYTSPPDLSDIQPLRHVVHHSPDGFEYGYAGSGPADLALSILAFVLDDEALAMRYHQAYKNAVVAAQPQEKAAWGTSVGAVKRWFDESSSHEWKRRVIAKGKHKGYPLPERCVRCGAVRRPDGKNGRCPVPR